MVIKPILFKRIKDGKFMIRTGKWMLYKDGVYALFKNEMGTTIPYNVTEVEAADFHFNEDVEIQTKDGIWEPGNVLRRDLFINTRYMVVLLDGRCKYASWSFSESDRQIRIPSA